MIDFFPTPYPSELWYSVMARYCACGGLLKFGNQTKKEVPRIPPIQWKLFPDDQISKTLSLLPTGIFTTESIILSNTIFPYVTRIYPIDRKQQLLKDLASGQRLEVTSSTRFQNIRRYCPLCRKEEKEQYGEAYWHREHQISMMGVCPIHGCRLVEFKTQCNMRSFDSGITLDRVPEHEAIIDFTQANFEKSLAENIMKFFTLPFDACPDPTANPLYEELYRIYPRAKSRYRNEVDYAAAYEAMRGYYGDRIARMGLSATKRIMKNQRLGNWSPHFPQWYLLLATMIGMKPETMLGLPV